MIRRFVPRTRGRIALAVLGLALVVGVPVALASHQFTDVPDSNPFHGDISAITDAGITSGKTCVPPGTPPTYCPSENITREAMAAFVHRGFGRVATTYMSPQDVPSDFAVPTGWSVNITPGIASTALAGASGFVQATASVNACNDRDDFGYHVNGQLLLDGTPMSQYVAAEVIWPGTCAVIGVTGVASVATAVPHTVSVQLDGPAVTGLAADGQLTVTYIPFGSTGTNTLGATATKNGVALDKQGFDKPVALPAAVK